MKKLIFLVALSLLVFSSCERGINRPSDDETTQRNAYTGVEFSREAVVLGMNGNSSVEFTEAFKHLLPVTNVSVSENTALLIVPELSAAYENELLKAYGNEATAIAVINPTASNIKAWYDKHGWYECSNPDEVKGAMIFSFGPESHKNIVKKVIETGNPDEEYDKDFESTLVEDEYNEMYIYLNTWIAALENDFDELTKVQSPPSGGSDMAPDVSTLFDAVHRASYFPYTINDEVRNNTYRHVVKGNGSIDVQFDVYQVHCYEDQPGAGDYYLVNMTASVANSDMWTGLHTNYKWGVWTRLCGYIATSFDVVCTPVDSTYKHIDPNKLSFIASGFPVPATVAGSTTYDKSHSANFGLSGSVGGKGTHDGSNFSPWTRGAKGGIEISAGWSWSESETRDISDMDIANTTSGNSVGYRLVYNNLPQYDDGKLKFKEGNAHTWRSTSSVSSSWIWYMKGAKDDSNAKPISIVVEVTPKYKFMSFVSSKADLDTKNFTVQNLRDTITLDPFIRDRCGSIILNNDFSDNTSIKSVQIYYYDIDGNEIIVWENKGTIKPGKEIRASAFPIRNEYMVYFTTTDGKKYKYSLFSTLSLEQGDENLIYAATDFREMQ